MVIDGFHHVTCHTQICVGVRAKVRNMAMQISAYLSSLPWEARKRYTEKLNIGGVTLPDPYGIDQGLWTEDMARWPTLEFGDLYSYLVNTKGLFTQETLKAYRSLEAYNYFFNGYVRTYQWPRLAILQSKSCSYNHRLTVRC